MASDPIRFSREYPGVPKSAAPFSATNGTDIDGTTARAIKAAVTGKRHWITQIHLTNKTAAETPIIKVQDDSGTPVVLYTTKMGGLADADAHQTVEFDPPLEVAAGKAINGVATSAVGDVLVTAVGFVEA